MSRLQGRTGGHGSLMRHRLLQLRHRLLQAAVQERGASRPQHAGGAGRGTSARHVAVFGRGWRATHGLLSKLLPGLQTAVGRRGASHPQQEEGAGRAGGPGRGVRARDGAALGRV